MSALNILIKDELEQAGGTRGYRNVATVKKNLRVSNPDEVKRVEKLAANYSIVATLIATVTFAAGFTVPGGNYSDGPHKGMAVLSKKAAFITFVISDSLAMFASIGAVLGLTVLFQTKNYRLKLAIVRINRKRIFGAVMLMMIAFLAGLCAVLPNLAVMIVPYVLAAWLGGLICFTFSRKFEGRECNYTTRFNHSEAEYGIFYPLRLYTRWYQDLTEAED
nr:ankyrin repeat-containing protein ITN1-like [Coffea arabica]